MNLLAIISPNLVLGGLSPINRCRFYREVLVRAAASVLSPLGWRTSDIEQKLGQYTESSLASFR